MKMSLDALNGDRQQLTDELEKYKKHILILTEQNDKLANELEEVLDRDMKLRMQLNRTERLEMVIDQNRNILENSLDNLKAGNNKNDSFMKRTYEVDNNKGIGSTLRSQNSTLAASRGFSG
jgi:chromosome segregation ATPase